MLENMFVTDDPGVAYLRTQGFTEAEATMLTFMKQHIEEQSEYRERVEEQQRLNFARWLVEQGRIGK
jgi:hypothetical protein